MSRLLLGRRTFSQSIGDRVTFWWGNWCQCPSMRDWKATLYDEVFDFWIITASKWSVSNSWLNKKLTNRTLALVRRDKRTVKSIFKNHMGLLLLRLCCQPPSIPVLRSLLKCIKWSFFSVDCSTFLVSVWYYTHARCQHWSGRCTPVHMYFFATSFTIF